jgi:hypothetical protein
VLTAVPPAETELMMKAAEKAHEAVQLAQKTLQQTLKEGGSTAAGQWRLQ